MVLEGTKQLTPVLATGTSKTGGRMFVCRKTRKGSVLYVGLTLMPQNLRRKIHDAGFDKKQERASS